MAAPAPVNFKEAISPGLRKVAVVLLSMDEEVSASILREFTEQEIHDISHALACVGRVTPEETRAAISDYLALLHRGEFSLQGGADVARKLLVRALGEEGAQKPLGNLMRKLSPPPPNPIVGSDPGQLARLLSSEHPQTIALILTRLPITKAASLLAALPPEDRPEIAYRLANMDDVSPIVMRQITEVIEQKLETMCDASRIGIAGTQMLAEMCNLVEVDVADEILGALAERSADTAAKVREKMFVFEDILRLDQAAMKQICAAVDRKVLTTALKGTTDEMKEHFMKQFSQRAKEMIKEDMEALGPVRIKDVEMAQDQVVAAIHDLDRQGLISIRGGASQGYVE